MPRKMYVKKLIVSVKKNREEKSVENTKKKNNSKLYHFILF